MKNKFKIILNLIFFFTYGFFLMGAGKPEASRNPFKDWFPVEKKIEKIIFEDQKKKEPLDVSRYALTGIVWGDYEPRVIINNKVYKVGDNLDEAKILTIDKEGVVVECEGEKYTIKIMKYGGGR